MSTKNILKPLSDIGLSKYEAKVYLTLVSEGISTAKNVSDITGIPYGKVYEIINSLTYKGFAMVLPSKPMKYRAISPRHALESAKKESNKKFEKIEDSIMTHLESLFAVNKQFNAPKSAFSIINGRSNVINKSEELIKKAKNNIHIHCSANSLSRLTLHKEALKEAFDRGVDIFIAGITNKENLEEIKSLSFLDLRHINNSHNNFLSVDGKECLVVDSIPDDDNIIYGRDLGIHAVSHSFTKFIDSFFDSDYRKGKVVFSRKR